MPLFRYNTGIIDPDGGVYTYPIETSGNKNEFRAPAYHRLVESTGGKYGLICDADYTQTLSAISRDIAGILKSQFTLSQVPDSGEVWVFRAKSTRRRFW